MNQFDAPTESSDRRQTATESQSSADENLAASTYLENDDTTSSNENKVEALNNDLSETDSNFDLDQSDVTKHLRTIELANTVNSSADLPSLTIDFSPPESSSNRRNDNVLPDIELSRNDSRIEGSNNVKSSESASSFRRSTGEGAGTQTEDLIPPKAKAEGGDFDDIEEIELPPVFDRSSERIEKSEANDSNEDIEKPLQSDQSYWRDKPRLSREEVLEKAGEHIKDPIKMKAFGEDVDAFEKRAQEDGVSDLERETFYGQIGKVLDASKEGNQFYNGEQLQTIASAMMKHAGSPGSVNQGTEPTCTTAALESVLYAKEPNTIGEVVSEAALTGQYVTASGDTVKIPERNLLPDKYKADTPEQKARSLASHIFQPLSINMKWNSQDSYFGQEDGKKGKLVYEEGHPKEHPGDIQTRIMDYSKTPPEPVTQEVFTEDPLRDKNAPSYSIPEVRPANAPMMFMDDLPKIYSDLKGREGSLTTTNIDKAANVETPETKEEFQKLLEKAASSDGNSGPSFPMLLGVHANLEPFTTDLHEYSGDRNLSEEDKNSESAMHAHHAVAIFGYDPETKMVELENQWGPKADHTGEEGRKEKIHIDDLYRTFKGLSPEETQKLNEAEPDKEPTPDEIIDSQRKFVEEIAKDENQDPQKVWQERRELYRRLNHFGRDEEAREQRDILVKDFEKLSIGKDYEQVSRMGTDLITSLRGADENEMVKSVVSKLDTKFLESVSDKPDIDSRSNADGLLRLHESLGDHEGKATLLNKYLDQTIGDGTKLDIGDQKERGIMLDNLSLAHLHGDSDTAKKYFGSMVKNFRSFENEKGDRSPQVLEAKGDLMMEANQIGAKDTAYELADELQTVYDDLSKNVDTEEEFKEGSLSNVRLSLRSHYIKTKQPEKLEPIIEDYMRYHEEFRLEDGQALGKEGEHLVGPLSYMGRRLREGGAVEKSAEYFERGLEQARKYDPDESGKFARDLASVYLQLGKESEAAKLINEFDLPGYMFRKYRSK